MTKLFNIISGITIILTLAFIATIAYWLFYPYEPITFTYHKSRILNTNHEVHRGEPILWEVDATYDGHYDVQISRRIVDGFVFYTPDTSIKVKPGHVLYTQSAVTVPNYLPYGTYHEVLYLKFRVNPIREVTVVRESEDFKVVPFNEGDTLQQERNSEVH